MCSGDEFYQKRQEGHTKFDLLENWLETVSIENVRLLAKVRPEHLKWFLGLTKKEFVELIRKTTNGPYRGGQEIF
jgi:hypothetical protein